MKLIIDYNDLVELCIQKSIEIENIMDISEKIIKCDECDYKAFIPNFCVKNGLHECPECGYCGEGKRERG